jgi:hypothetical protein
MNINDIFLLRNEWKSLYKSADSPLLKSMANYADIKLNIEHIYNLMGKSYDTNDGEWHTFKTGGRFSKLNSGTEGAGGAGAGVGAGAGAGAGAGFGRGFGNEHRGGGGGGEYRGEYRGYNKRNNREGFNNNSGQNSYHSRTGKPPLYSNDSKSRFNTIYSKSGIRTGAGGGGSGGGGFTTINKYKQTKSVDDAIMNTIRGKLNKLSESNYTEFYGFMCQILDEGQTEFLTDFMKLLFEKAILEELFCKLYAQLIADLSIKYKVLKDELITKYNEYDKIFMNTDECTLDRTYYLGYSQFLSDLITSDVISYDMLLSTIMTIIDSIKKISLESDKTEINEKFIDCLHKIIRVILDKNDTEITANIKGSTISKTLLDYTERNPLYKSINQRIRLTLKLLCNMLAD